MRTPLALLASLGLSLALQDAAFDPSAWFLIDFAVIAVIASARLSRAEWAIVALFAPAWAAYFLLPPTPRHYATLAVVLLQLALTIPMVRQLFHRLVSRWKANFRHRDEWTDLRARGSHE